MDHKNQAIHGILCCFAFFTALWVISCSSDSIAPHKTTYATLLVSSEGNGIITMCPTDGKAPIGTEVSLLATPDSGYVFAGYFGDVRSADNPLIYIVTGNAVLSARFAKRPDSNKMAMVPAAWHTFSMGAFGGLSQVNERPPHPACFTYDFFMDKYEVTQALYLSVMGTNPAIKNAAQGAFGIGDRFPVYNVSYYDAVRFCNERSKRDGYDTVYTYTAVCKSGTKCPYMLEGLTTHYDRLGYRLPTEAEWEYACRAGSLSGYFWGDSAGAQASRFAWYVGNSNNASHPVGAALANPLGLYDMTGNVSEFVNDWLGPYGDSLVVNPVGPTHLSLEQFEASWERPLRGGCWALGTSFLRSSCRSGPYAMPAFSMSPQVGFRAALGVFSPGAATPASSQPGDSLGITLTCAKSDLLSLIGASRVKIVFVKENNGQRRLCCIDFTSPAAAVFECADSAPAHGPVVSPNGSYVAYGSQSIGFSAPSQTTVRSLDATSSSVVRTQPNGAAYMPCWWVDSTAPYDTFIVYAEGASMNNLPEWISERTMRQRMNGTALNGPVEVLCDKGSYHGGISRSGQFLATGYPNAYFYDIKLNHRIRFFLPPYSGRDDTAQVCNVSITPGLTRPDEIMFLDFGYPSRNSTVVGKPYRFHSVIFVCNSCVGCNTHVRNWYEVPAGYEEWNFVKWSNHPDFAAATARSEGTGSGSSIFLINLRDSSYLRVASGDGISDPYCWIDPAEASETPDLFRDFAHYDVPMRVNYFSQLIINKKMKLFWKRRASIDVGVFGSSSAYYGVDPSAMPSFTAVNMATLMGELLLSEILCTEYFLAQSPKLKAVIIGVDPGFFDANSNWGDPFLNGLYDSQGFQFDKKNGFWKTGVPQQVENKISAFGSDSWLGLDSAGFGTDRTTGGWGAPVIDKGDYSVADTFVQTNLLSLAVFSDTLAARGIHVFAVHFPENPLYAATGSVGRYGPSSATYATISRWLDSLTLVNPYFHYYDANADGKHDYASGEALDPNHLNYLGAKKLSARLDSLIKVYVK
jgi:formylglycine-generating enzyme required for sulfatase activity